MVKKKEKKKKEENKFDENLTDEDFHKKAKKKFKLD